MPPPRHNLLHGEITLTSFTPERLADPAIRALAHKVGEKRNAGWGREQAASGSLTICLDDGSELREAVPIAAGDPRRPLSEAELEAKFAHCAALAAEPWPESRSAKWTHAILHAPLDRSIAQLFD